MTCLIHLNGPPGIGKSTLSALYTDRHPGTLDLDIDSLHRLVGGWQDPENRTHDVLRPVALAMASTHLGGGRDVIFPQYLSKIEEIEAFENAAHDRGADFREIVLLDERPRRSTGSITGGTTAPGGARFVRTDLSGAVMRGVDLQGTDIDAPWLFDGHSFLRVNGVDVTPLVEAELNRRSPAARSGAQATRTACARPGPPSNAPGQ